MYKGLLTVKLKIIVSTIEKKGEKTRIEKRENVKSKLLEKKHIKIVKIYLMSRYRAEILCIFFNTKHFRGVLYCCYFALNVFKVSLVLKLQRKSTKAVNVLQT